MRLNWLLKSCVLDLIFDQALPGAMRALKTQIEHVLLCVKGEKTLNTEAVVKELRNDMCKLTTQLCEQQRKLVEEFAKGFLPSVSTRAANPNAATPAPALTPHCRARGRAHGRSRAYARARG